MQKIHGTKFVRLLV
jgi:uncharacterized protein (TIGR02246 family)